MTTTLTKKKIKTHINFRAIECYLVLFDLQIYLLYIILNLKNLKFKHSINDIIIDL